jgi:multiple sugar transport system ATP-binding protein
MNAATIGVRPEHIAASRDGEGWRGTVVAAEHLGSDTFLYIDVPQTNGITARAIGELGLKQGDPVRLTPDPARIHRFDAQGRALRP